MVLGRGISLRQGYEGASIYLFRFSDEAPYGDSLSRHASRDNDWQDNWRRG